MTRRPAAAVLVLAAALALGACGEKSEEIGRRGSEALRLTLDGRPGADHAGIYMAQQLGYFREAGLELTIETPPEPAAAIERAASGRADLAISHAPEVLLGRERGLEAIAVGAIVPQPLTATIWLRKAGIGGIAELRGRTIATAGLPYQEALLGTILARAGLAPEDVRTFDAGYGLLPALLEGRAAALLGARNAAGVALRARGKRPEVTPVDRLGVPSYEELVLVTAPQRLQRDAKSIRLFLAALARGTAAAAERPGAATEALLEANPDLDRRTTRAALEATLPLLSRSGQMDPAEWRRLAAWMRDNGLIGGRPAPAELLSNEYLAGRIPD